jgi:hypothetical protein
MDAIFALAPGTRACVLERTAARIPGCLYLFLWAPVISAPLTRSGYVAEQRSPTSHLCYFPLCVAICVRSLISSVLTARIGLDWAGQPFVLLGRVDRRRRRSRAGAVRGLPGSSLRRRERVMAHTSCIAIQSSEFGVRFSRGRIGACSCVPGWAYKDGRAYMEVPEPDLTASASLQVQQQFYHVSKRATSSAIFILLIRPILTFLHCCWREAGSRREGTLLD